MHDPQAASHASIRVHHGSLLGGAASRAVPSARAIRRASATAVLSSACVVGLLCFLSASPARAAEAPRFQIGESDFLLDGKPILIRCGELHSARIPREYWEHRLRMCRAMGLNAVCAYLFWNLHEPEPGRWEWSGNADVAEFCRIAQREGLLVILRPGPYSCAEWDFGGFPWWLLKTPDIRVRTRDARYIEACRKYLASVGRELAPLQITRGGPIIMVQVENEYGSYGNDREYIGILRDHLKAAGFDVPLFTCDGPSQLKNDTRDDIFCVVNFGSDPAGNFKALRAVRSSGPLMCGEYYPGWFDSWGKPHHYGDTARIVGEVGWMLENNASFSIYMVHGGTSFGFTAGANCPPFSPQTTSYDYDAPISEAGWDTPKFHALRELFTKHLSPGETLPPVPARNPVMAIPKVELAERAPLFSSPPPAAPQPGGTAKLPGADGIRDERPRCMELHDLPHGCILYRTKLPAGGGERLVITELHDFGLIFIDGRRIGVMDRRRNQAPLLLPEREAESTLDILVEAFGHVNYGGYIHDRKGITEKVELVTPAGAKELTGWTTLGFPLRPQDIERAPFEKTAGTGASELPALYRGSFQLERAGDTFLDLGKWGKGLVWINGRNLGRFWKVGPHQTLYCPGPWLKPGRNEIVVLELLGAEEHAISGLAEPILDRVNEQGPAKHRKEGQRLELDGLAPAHAGSFAAGKDWQTVRFPAVRGRQVCLEALSSHAADAYTTCAELHLLGPDGKDLPRDAWKVIYADSEETGSDDGSADNIFDLQPTTFWHTEWERVQPAHPHQVLLDLGTEETITGVRYLPRQDSANGRIKDFRIYVGSSIVEKALK